jgi:hypothetical protein
MTSEKAQFWQTVCLTTRADGQSPVQPMLVQQVVVMTEAHVLGLPADWAVHNTESGYMDQAGWEKYAKHFVAATGHGEARAARPHLFLFIDGHDSHQSPEGLQYFLDHNVHLLFLRQCQHRRPAQRQRPQRSVARHPRRRPGALACSRGPSRAVQRVFCQSADGGSAR